MPLLVLPVMVGSFVDDLGMPEPYNRRSKANAWGFTLPYFQAIEADLDRGGTVVVAGGFATGFAGFIGPATAASLVRPGDYSTLLMSCFAVCFMVILLMRYVTARIKVTGG